MSIGTGVFVSFEGGEGAGKSTQIRLLAETLRHRGHEVLLTREPGGSRGAEAVRHVLLSGAAEEFGTRMEAILFAAARSDHVDHVIRPALMKGRIVLCDRFIDSSRVYQGATGNLDRDFIEALVRVAINGVMPDRTIMVDVPASIGLERARRRGAAAAAPDRFEKESLQMHEKRREAFLDIAAAEPDRCRVVDGTKPEMLLAQDILGIVEPLLSRKHAYPASARERER